jgi:tetratricopeptide (TPR) repeat protein
MPLPGGATDKFGNRYEGRWTVHCITEVLAGCADSIRLEPPGTAGEGIEFWLRKGDSYEYHQVKRQNTRSGHWSLAELDRKGILSHFWTKLQDPSSLCYFTSTHSAFQLDELSDRARRAVSWDEFSEEFLKAKEQLGNFQDLCQRWPGCTEVEVYEALKRVYVKTIDEDFLRKSVERDLEILIEGNPANVADILAQLVLDKVHSELTADDIWDHLKDRGYHRRYTFLADHPSLLEESSVSTQPIGEVQDGIAEILKQQKLNFARLESLIVEHLPERSTTAQKGEASPDSWQAWLKQAEACYAGEDVEKALVAVNKAWELNKGAPQIAIARGCILAEYAIAKRGPKSMLYEAITLFESLRDQTPEPAGIDYNIGNCFTGLEEHQKAVEHFEKALAAGPSPELAAQIWKNKGTSYFYLGNDQEEIASYKKALELNPNLFEAYASWGAAELRNHNYQRARELLERAFEVEPDREMRAYPQLYSLAYTLWKLGDFEGAYRWVNQVLTLQPTHQDGLLLKAYLLRQLWREDAKYVSEAIAFYEAWILDNPESTAARNELHLIYHSDEYQHDSRTVLEQTALSPSAPVQSLYHYAMLLDDEGKPEKAVKYLEAASEKSQEHHIVHKLGILKEKTGDYSNAIKFYQLALRDVDNSIPILHGIADCYHFLGEYRECVRVLTRAILIDPEDEISWTNLGYALDQLGVGGISFICFYILRRFHEDRTTLDEEIQAAIDELLSRLRVEFGEDFVAAIEREAGVS